MRTSTLDGLQIEFDPRDIASPKRAKYGDPKVVADWYGYYAGYSGHFVHDVLQSFDATQRSVVLDPWNGSGTTTAIAALIGCEARGFDLNPAMTVISRARTAWTVEADDIIREIQSSMRRIRNPRPTNLPWLSEATNHALGYILQAVSASRIASEFRRCDQECVAMTALFGTARHVLAPLQGTNRTWWKSDCRDPIDVAHEDVTSSFFNNIRRFASSIDHSLVPPGVTPRSPLVSVGNSRSLPMADDTVDVVVTSPPYLTRLDYVTAMLPELLLLGLTEEELVSLRKKMTGNTMGGCSPWCDQRWGHEAADLINHATEAAMVRKRSDGRYYAATFARYFDDLFNSLTEIDRVAKKGAAIAIVVQGSRHRGRLADLPLVVYQMATSLEWKRSRVIAWPTRDIGRLNPYSRRYTAHAVLETALLFTKQ